ncbi:uncharacterized protein K452DRAFT_271333 [Aplosporella prunicola CBS 121167]|uniref:RRM domain-containing protein n=1 Tax=Aplosporella prunicola CBS 121167 TaxID=1176127 RepID=A0A6A6BFI3_9PEZI|nr:uncharacterized protein K452DRAFT_271333 [Aplosporella prunicola CBS 121167]KAF2141677.1 hypothetical protein K452DRAFT_271333 [Aplosporella prunicola CBS 121167]
MRPGFSHPGALRAREKNFFIISGVCNFRFQHNCDVPLTTAQLPFNYTWRALKDLVRNYTINQPGWTEMDEGSYGTEGRKGYFSVKTDEDAANFPEFRDSGRRLLVHHWDASQTQPVLLRCNCSAVFPAATRHSDRESQVTAQFVNSALYQSEHMPVPPGFATMSQSYPAMTAATSGPMPMMHAQPSHMVHQPAYYLQHPPATPVYSQAGIPVNVRNGAVRTEARGIHIRGLKYTVTEAELKQLLAESGNPLRIELKKGSATVRFGSSVEADRAIEGLNGFEYKGMELSVRYDVDRTPVSEPVIVNGGPHRVSRRHQNNVIVKD